MMGNYSRGGHYEGALKILASISDPAFAKNSIAKMQKEQQNLAVKKEELAAEKRDLLKAKQEHDDTLARLETERKEIAESMQAQHQKLIEREADLKAAQEEAKVLKAQLEKERTDHTRASNDLAHKVKMLQQDQNKVLADQATVDRLKAEAEKMHREYTEKLAKLRDVMATV